MSEELPGDASLPVHFHYKGATLEKPGLQNSGAEEKTVDAASWDLAVVGEIQEAEQGIETLGKAQP